MQMICEMPCKPITFLMNSNTGVFNVSGCLTEGYYPGVSAPPGLMALIVPCRLGEVELALTFEMFITVNAAAISPLSGTTTAALCITLNRYQDSGCFLPVSFFFFSKHQVMFQYLSILSVSNTFSATA